jgi:hypothetical protein
MATMSSDSPPKLDKKAFLISLKVPKMATMFLDSPPMLDKKAFLASYKVPQICRRCCLHAGNAAPAPFAPTTSATSRFPKAAGRGRGQVEVVRALIDAADGSG